VLKGCIAHGTKQILVRWKGAPAVEASWEELDDFMQHYTEFQLADELFVQGGRDVMYDRTFGRRLKSETYKE
jgi:hypothetical protein